MTIMYALLAALAFGVSDYFGGALSRTEPAEKVTASTQLMVAIFYVGAAFLLPGEFSWDAIFYGMISGACSALGLMLFYKALAEGVAGVVASSIALGTALIPAAWGFARGDSYSVFLLVGIAIAVVAVIFLTREEKHESQQGEMSLKVWLYVIGSGALLATGIISLSHTTAIDGFYPLLGVAMSAIPISVIVSLIVNKSVFVSKKGFGIAAFTAVVIAVGYVAQLSSVRGNVLAVASVVGALYPLPTIVLARILDKEKLTIYQLLGIGLSLVAVAVIALS